MKLKEISIEITQQCPNYCIHCSSYSSWEQKQSMPYELICSVIKDAIELGATKICISGGEPFLHPKLSEIVDCISGLGAKCVIYTSGIYYDGNTFQSLPLHVLMRIKERVEKIIINYEAADSETYDTIMGTHCGGYVLMRQSISLAVSMGINVETHIVPMKINHQQIPLIIQQCNDLGVTRVSLLRIVRHGRVLNNDELIFLTAEEEHQLVEKTRQIATDQSMSIRFGIPFSNCSKSVSCNTGIIKLNIRYDGLVYPCEAFKNDLPQGFITSRPESVYEKSLLEIYEESSYLKEIRQKLHDFQSVNTCERCMNQYYTNQKEIMQ